MNDMKKTTKRFTHILKKATTILAVFVVFLSTYAMTLPALTLDEETADTEAGIVLEENNNTEEEISDELSFEQSEENNEAVIEISENEETIEETDENIEEIHEEEKTIESFGPFFFYDDSTDVIVSVEAPEGAFEENTVMIVTPVREEEIIDTVNSTLEENSNNKENNNSNNNNSNTSNKKNKTNKASKIQAVDISFYCNGIEVEPLLPIRVSLTSKLIKESNKDPQIVHIDDKGEGEIIEQSSDVESKEDEVIFEAESFSTYVLVITTDYITDEGDTYKITVTYDEEAGIPEGAYLDVEEITGERFNELYDQTTDLLDAEFFSYARIFDITIYDDESNHVDPSSNVEVSIELLDEVDENDNFTVVHFAPEATKVNSRSEGNSVSFETDGFSAYAIVQGPGAVQPGWIRISTLADLKEKAAEGMYIGTTGNYYLRNNTTAHSNGGSTIAGLSGIQRSTSTRAYPTDDAALYYFEEVEGQTNQFYLYCYDANNNKLYVTYDTEATAVPYSIILTADETKKTPCTVSVTGSGATAYWRIRFNNNANLRWYLRNNIFDAQNSDTNYYFYQNLGTDVDTYGLDGKTYGLMYWIEGIMGKGLMSDANETAGHLDALALTVMSKANNGSKLYVPDNSDLSFWTFHFIDTDNYYLTTVVDGSTKYLRLGSDGATLVSVPDNNCKIRVVPGTGSNAGKIYLRSGNYTLAYSGNIDEGFKIGGTAGNEWLNLVEESELDNTYFMTYSARKVSVSDENITNGSRIIVYTRVWNETTLKYEFYAIDHDGSLVRCYESGDSIEWVGGRLNSMLWNFIEYYWEGKNDPNYYYDLYNQYSDKFIAPQASDGQIISDDRIGINLNGRRNGLYYSPIVAWDDAYYAYAGLKADTATGKIVSCSLSEADDFYFAIVHDIPVDDELTIIPTIDHTQYGITMKMVNFGTDIFTGNDNANVQSKMSAFLGSANSTQGYNAESGLLNTALVGGYPVVSSNGNSLSTWFSNAQEVNHLFIASTYSGTGYFEYDSVQNFAHLNQDTNNFVVYKELGSDNTGGPTHTHGLFFPYNDITAGVFSPNKNTTAISSAALPESDPRKYETMYLVQKSNTNYAPDYYFGMELTATFTQTPNGLDDWGHDIIYEFTGDDDFWLFVDGELIIDLGGIHSAISGDVNYRTGVVHVNGTSTTLRSLFESNYRGRNPELSDADVAAYLNEIFDGEIFKDYTTHTMSIYYLEHGAGSSNLHMRFNLASIKPGTAQLTKKLSGVDTTETVLAEFPYQIIYRTKNGDADPVAHYLTNSVADDPDRIFNYVFYKDSTVPCTYKTSISIAEKTYNDVFILKPDETVDINFPTETFPEGTELLDYRIIECGVNTDVYEAVRVNDKVITGTTVYDDNNTPVEDRKDYGIEYATTNDRARVVYENEVALDAITNLYIKKRLYDVTGEHEISASQDDTTFDFRLYLATDTGDIDNSPANMHTYHVLDADGNYCYWSVADQRLKRIEPGIGDFSALTEAQKTSATFNTSMNGSISRIPVGYTIEVRDLLVGTKFKVVERPSEIPDGYSFLKYVYSEKEYTDTEAGVSDVVVSQIKPHVEVHNIKGFGLRVNKTWTDADFMSGRGPVYFGIFYQDGNEWKVVPDSLRQMAYGTTTVYWYYDRLPVEGLADFSKYVIYEVKLTQPVVDDDGNVVSYTNLDRLDNGGSVTLSGTQIGDTEPSDFTYTVEYERGELNTNSNVRVDEVTNSRPGIIIKKTEWDGTTALQGAVFTMKDEDNNLIGTYTSDEDGLIVEAFLRENVKYYLTETSAPQGWQGLLSDMTIKLNGEIIVIGGVDDDYYMVSTDATTDTKIITVKNRPYEFKVVKMDKGTGKPLQGVKFALYREIVVDSVHSWDPNPYPGYESLTSGNDGIVISRALPAGKYQLRETKALSGYQTLSGYITFTISSTGVIELDSNTPEEATLTYDTGENGSVLYQITITNTKEFKVSIWKTNEGYETITSGASFKLYKAEDYNDTTSTIKDGAIPLVSGTTGENGILALGTLTVGEYRLIETAAPAGYNMAESAIRISVKNNGVTALQEGNLSVVYKKGDQYWVAGQDNATWQIRVWNNPGVELPHTGGIGTTIFRMAGLTLILAAGIVLIFKKRH